MTIEPWKLKESLLEFQAEQAANREAPEMTVRTCAKCGRRFVWPVGSRPPHGLCRHCQPDQMSLT